MTQIISQDELDTLLSSIAVADRQRRPASEAATAALYDFRYASKLSPDHMRLMQGRLGGLTGALNRTMSLYLNNNAHFHVHSLDVTSYDQYLRNLAARPLLGVVTFEGGASPALWEISAPLATAALDCMLGGSGTAPEQSSREATPIERAVLRRLFQEIVSCWTELWDRLQGLRPQVDTVVTSHAGIDLRAMDERMFSAALECSIAGVRGMMRICMPLSVVKRLLRDEREVVRAVDVAGGAEAMPTAQPLTDTPVTFSARLEPPAVPLAELTQLQPGTVLNLRLPANEPFVVYVGEVPGGRGRPRFHAQAGSANGRLAVQITAAAEAPTEA